jgi:hypothetical protein
MTWLKIIFLGLGVARLIEWVKELMGFAAFPKPPMRNWPGRFSKMVLNMLFSGAATAAYCEGRGWKNRLLFFLGVSATATTAHTTWSTLAAARDLCRLPVMDRIRMAGRR